MVHLATNEHILTLLKDESCVAANAACGMAILADMATKFRVAKADLVKLGRILSKTVDSDDDVLLASFVPLDCLLKYV